MEEDLGEGWECKGWISGPVCVRGWVQEGEVSPLTWSMEIKQKQNMVSMFLNEPRKWHFCIWVLIAWFNDGI